MFEILFYRLQWLGYFILTKLLEAFIGLFDGR